MSCFQKTFIVCPYNQWRRQDFRFGGAKAHEFFRMTFFLLSRCDFRGAEPHLGGLSTPPPGAATAYDIHGVAVAVLYFLRKFMIDWTQEIQQYNTVLGWIIV